MSGSHRLGPLGRLALWSATHRRTAVGIWVVLVCGLGVFVPQVPDALSGGGMERTGSESVQARELIRDISPHTASSAPSVVMIGRNPYLFDKAYQRAALRVVKVMAADPAVGSALGPRKTGRISPDGRTVVISGAALRNTTGMIRASHRLRDKVQEAAGPQYKAYMSGLSAQWADFNENNHEAAISAEKVALPLTLIVLALAFGSMAAAGLPLLITLIGLCVTGGGLYGVTRLMDLSLWSLEFVLIFSLALGIDYALFIVMRFRDALEEHETPTDAIVATMDTAGRAVAFSAVTVLVALGACFLIPSPMPRAIALGIWMSVILVLSVMFTLMPALLAKLGPRIDAGAMPWKRNRTPKPEADRLMHRWGEILHRRAGLLAAAAVLIMVLLALPVGHLKVGIPGLQAQPKDAPSRLGAEQVERAFGVPETAPVSVVVKAGQLAQARRAMLGDRELTKIQDVPVKPGSEYRVLQANLELEPNSEAAGRAIDRLRADLPSSAMVGHAVAEMADFRSGMEDIAPLVIGLILLLGFCLLLVAVKAPVIALIGTATSLLSTAAAFGIAVLVFQDGHMADVIGIESQGFVDFWAPVFFFAMIFAIAMDYTVFFVSAAREQYDRTKDNRVAIVAGMGRSGPVIVAAAVAMISVFIGFAISQALPAKEMGTILGVAVLLDAFLVRLVLLPALMRLAGDWAWWQPTWLNRILPKFSLSHEGGHPVPAAAVAAPAPASVISDPADWFAPEPVAAALAAPERAPREPGVIPADVEPIVTAPVDARAAILGASRDLFAYHGFAGVTVSDIAHRAGVRDATVYEYFESTDEILATLFDHVLDRVLIHHREQPGDPHASLHSLISAQVATALEDRASIAVWLHEERALVDPYRRRIGRRKQEHIDRWLHALRACDDSGRDEAELTMAIHATIGLLLSTAEWPQQLLLDPDVHRRLTDRAYGALGIQQRISDLSARG